MSLTYLQTKIGVKADGVFGPATLKAARDYFKLTDAQAAHFFGQCYHESGGFKRFTENLNYSADGLMRVFKKYFPTMSVARAYAGDAQAIANKVYASRMGNGPVTSGDGWQFRGRGAIQLTGRNAYQALSNTLPGIMHNPDLVASEFAFESAIWFFRENNILPLCKVVTIDSVQRSLAR